MKPTGIAVGIAVASLIMGMASIASAAPSTSNVFDMDAAIADKNAHLSGNVPTGTSAGGSGDNTTDPYVIGGLPFADTGSTCSFLNDYDAVCPYTGSTSTDVVYRYIPGSNQTVQIDLCTSLYDTKVYVYETAAIPGTEIACSDDAGCGITGYQSLIPFVNLTGGQTYYIVVDGYAGDCGDYDLTVGQTVPPTPCGVCPPDGQLEGEPVCADNYADVYNGGCNTIGFSPVNCSTICGEAGTYFTAGGQLMLRDTDWYQLNALAGTYKYKGLPDGFDLQLLITDTNCPLPGILNSTSTPSCVMSSELSITFFAPTTVYLWAGSLFFDGVPCGSKYTLFIEGPGIAFCGFTGACCLAQGTVCEVLPQQDCIDRGGLYQGDDTTCEANTCIVAVEEKTWGAIKNIFK